MAEMKQGRWSAASVPDRLDTNTAELVAELRDLFSEHPPLASSEPEMIRRALWMNRRVRVSTFDVEIALEALRVDGEVLA